MTTAEKTTDQINPQARFNQVVDAARPRATVFGMDAPQAAGITEQDIRDLAGEFDGEIMGENTSAPISAAIPVDPHHVIGLTHDLLCLYCAKSDDEPHPTPAVIRQFQNTEDPWLVVGLTDAADLYGDLSDPLGEPFHLAVLAELRKLGMKATYEYPGFVKIDRGDGTFVCTGQHGWDYGGGRNADGSPCDDADTEQVRDWLGEITPAKVAATWFWEIEGVNPDLDSLTADQMDAIAKQARTIEEGGIGGGVAGSIKLHSVTVRLAQDPKSQGYSPDEDDEAEDNKRGMAVAEFRYIGADHSEGQPPGLEVTVYSRGGSVVSSQDFG
jgi:hypothetical protein